MSDISTDKGAARPAPRSGLDRFFAITERGSTVAREVRGGLVTFVAMVYIVVLNPLIIGTAPDKNHNFLGAGHTFDLGAVAAVTALVAAFFTLLMGIVGRYPFALATGLGLNAFVAFQVANKMSWPEAMGMVVIEGLVITVLVLTGFRTAVFHAIPRELKSAIAVGIGLFIALIGFVDAGFVRGGSGTPVQLGGAEGLRGWPTLVFVVGLLLTAVLMIRKVNGALLIGIAVATVLSVIIEAVADVGAFDVKTNPDGWKLNVPSFDGKSFGMPDLHLLGSFSLGGGFSAVGIISGIVIVFSLVLSDFFDVMGTTIGLGSEAKLLDERGNLPRIGPVLFVDGVAAVGGGAAGASSATTYVESAAGIGDGARTGLASVVTGLLFVVTIFLSPIAQIVPSEAATPALVVVGVLLMGQVREIDFRDLSIAVPAFLTIVLMPFTYSITNGVGAGFVSWVVIRVCTGRARTVHPLLWIVSVLFAVYFAIAPLKTLFGID
ncbi:putative MFS transporter, AGZA family, xanthine/uracil permease [Jatrophihabitans endophyticus]|uniref:Putative MFS transporter, AGZA family, xanthine/uracil permease n=1 Tax=Jatrophihabitans endophyticus TaxID=1206085 RepID=A0A1M5T1S9_9ACTN|nr:NCS2 family permease [Jatrophihabitans endophyticus]SHH44628.1 putative MFS transporter, AGZA family, xanthine/uracil permease [Jatrophihabitans endophyticus]